MLWIIIFLSVLSVSNLAENGSNYQEAVLNSVSLHSINGSSSGVPLFVLKMDLRKSYAMCYPNSSDHQLVLLSLTVCKHLGFDALHSFYPVNANAVGTVPHGKGLNFSANCSNYQLEQQFCQWIFLGKALCKNHLGINCAECNSAVEITDERKQEIIFPAYISCFTKSMCEWSIINKYPKNKVTVLEFNKKSIGLSHSFSEPETESEQIIEVRLFDLKLNKWIAHRTTTDNLDSVDPIKVFTNNISISYISTNCQFDLTKRTRRNVVSVKYYIEEKETSFSSQRGSDIITYILCSIFLLALIIAITLCTCCYIRKQRNLAYNRHTGTYSVTYIPGLNVSYEEDYLPASLKTQSIQKNTELQNGYLLSQKQCTLPEAYDEVSNGCCKGIQPHIPTLKTFQNYSPTKQKSYLSSLLENVISCVTKTTHPPYISELFLPDCPVDDELDDTSLQKRFKVFDNLVLSFQWSDSAESVNTINADENRITDSNLAFFSGQHVLNSKNEQLKTLVSELALQYNESMQKSDIDDDFYSCASSGSPCSYYSMYPSRRTSRSESFISTISEPH